MVLEYVIRMFRWCEEKILLSEKKSEAVFKEGKIWWCKVGLNVGSEIYGKGERFIRPILIFRKFDGNMFLAIPLTSKMKSGGWYVPIAYGEKTGRAILVQARAMDKRRLVKRIGRVDSVVLQNVKDKFKNFYCSDNSYPANEGGAGAKSPI